MADLPDPLRPLESFLGNWRGEGAGAVPGGAGADFPYAEELTITNDGSPWLEYSTRVVDPIDRGLVLRVERGWIRAQPPADDGSIAVEMVIALPNGIVEVLLGGLVEGPSGIHLELASDVIARTPTATNVAADRRMYAIRGGKLMYAIDLATGEAGLVPHLAAALDPVVT
jgi:hypothetical protein